VFDVSFSELLVIAIVALLVIGPEKLPKVARTVGAFTGRMQRYMAQIKEEVNREVRFEELQKLQQEIKSTVENTQAEIKQFAGEVSTTKSKVKTATQSTVKSSKPITNITKSKASAVNAVKKVSTKKILTKKVSIKKVPAELAKLEK
jgi:sec-independent protein translocase protein TatB